MTKERYFVKVRELASGPKPGSQLLWFHELGCCVYFPVSAKFILFSASFNVISSPIESQRVHFLPSLVPGWLHVRALAGSLEPVIRLLLECDWHFRLQDAVWRGDAHLNSWSLSECISSSTGDHQYKFQHKLD